MLCAPGRPIVGWTEYNAQLARVRKKVPGRRIINATIIVANSHLRSCTTVLPRTRIAAQSRKFSHVSAGRPSSLLRRCRLPRITLNRRLPVPQQRPGFTVGAGPLVRPPVSGTMVRCGTAGPFDSRPDCLTRRRRSRLRPHGGCARPGGQLSFLASVSAGRRQPTLGRGHHGLGEACFSANCRVRRGSREPVTPRSPRCGRRWSARG